MSLLPWQTHLPSTSLCFPQAAKAEGDFLLVGLHTDEDVQVSYLSHPPSRQMSHIHPYQVAFTFIWIMGT